MPPKKKFASRAEEALQQRQAGVANAAKRRLGMGANQPGAKFAGKVSGSGMSPATGPAASFSANSRGRFTPRTLTGRPVGDGAGPPDVVGRGVKMGGRGATALGAKKFSTK